MAFGSGPFGTVPFGSGPRRSGGSQALSQFTVRIGSTEVNGYLRLNQWRANEVLNSRDTCQMHFLVKPSSPNPNYVPQLGERVLVQFGNVRHSAWTIHDVELSWTTEARNDLREVLLRCVDRTAVADRITVNEVYENKTAGEIIRHIIGKYLALDGITAGGVQDGPTIQKVVFKRRYAADCFDVISKLTGYHWTIDQYDVVQYFPKFASLAPFDIDQSANAFFRQAKVSRTLTDYRNVQFTTGAQGISDPLTYYHRGDGVRRTFETGGPLARLLAVRVNGNAEPQGIRQVDEPGSKAWYWNSNQYGVDQDPSRPLLQAADRVEIDCQIFYGPVETKLVNAPGIAARQAVEGGSGRYEVVDQDSSLDGLPVAIAKASADMRRFGSLDDVVQFELDRVGLAIGQTVRIYLPALNVLVPDGLDPYVPMLITEMETSLFALAKRRHLVTARAGELKGTYQEFFQQFFSRGVPVTISPDDIINEVAVAEDTASCSDLVTVTSGAAHSGRWGVDRWGMFRWA